MGVELVTLRIRHLRLRVTTSDGAFGADFEFVDGLNVLRGKNTVGKSTALISILYALGLEGMLGPSKIVPFAEVMTRRLQWNESEVDVLESFVSLEIEGSGGERIVCTRRVVGGTGAGDVIQVMDGPALSSEEEFKSRGYYVRVPGAATRESGFHTYLAQFIGWDLPLVPRFDGDPGPLYVECLFPFLFVEQLTGWRGIHARMPTFLGIPEMWNRSIEFLLNLGRANEALMRFQHEREKQRLQSEWRTALSETRTALRSFGAMIANLPDEPTATWPLVPAPVLGVITGSGWEPIHAARQTAKQRISELVDSEIPKVRDMASDLASAVRDREQELSQLESGREAIALELRAEEGYYHSLENRLVALEEDLRKNQDEFMIRKRGSVGNAELLSTDCPVCHRPRSDSLLSQDLDVSPMPVEANISHIRSEIGLFEELQSEQTDVIEAKRQRLLAGNRAIEETQALLREQRRAFHVHGDLPSAVAIRERIQAEGRLDRFDKALEEFQSRLSEFELLASQWRDNAAARQAARSETESTSDREKREFIEESFKSQLEEYGFSSYGRETRHALAIDLNTIRPTKDGFDLGQMSASDTIRTIWAYLIALLRCASAHKTNHPGLLIFDEPRQQSADKLSFAALIGIAAQSSSQRQQVIFATSEETPELLQAMRDADATVIELPVKVVKPL